MRPPMLYINFSTDVIIYLRKIKRISIISYLGADNDYITHNYKIELILNIKIDFRESLFEFYNAFNTRCDWMRSQ